MGLSSSRLETSHFRVIRQARLSAQSLVARVIVSTEGLSGEASRARGCNGSVGETSVHKDRQSSLVGFGSTLLSIDGSLP